MNNGRLFGTSGILPALAVSTLGGLALTSPAVADINLELRAVPEKVFDDEIVHIELWALSDDASDQGLSAIDLYFAWEPTFLELIDSFSADGGSTFFPFPDPAGANEAPLPADGDALMVFFGPLGTPIVATPEGTHVATLRFLALAPTVSTPVDILAEFGDGRTRVFDDKSAGLDVLGTISGTTVEINAGGRPVGACCTVDGTCAFRTEADCASEGGIYQGDGVDCDAPCPTGACCTLDLKGSCEITTEAECLDGGGIYEGDDTSCADVTCPDPEGACCFGDDQCQVTTLVICGLISGVFQGQGTTCTATGGCPGDPVTGACCLDDGSCVEVVEEDCAGVFQGDATTCAGTTCPEPTGACCLDDGSCVEVVEEDCAGVFQGDGSTCAGTTCPQPSGACCLDDGSCVEVVEEDCAGVFQGDATTCAGTTCPEPTGACCLDDGSCVEVV
ncbi:MAG: hypothetical protein KJO18_06765, partial [Acidimicrobiia bacterium]|nr:hypothetical protein [Acidimicrobiia bacterium]